MRIMPKSLSRRQVLKRLGVAGAGVAFSGGVLRAQTRSITIAGKPVEIAVASVSPSTVRITALPVGGPSAVADDGALVAAAAGKALGRRSTPESLASIRAGDLTVRFTAEPPTIHIDTASGKEVQRLTLDASRADHLVSDGEGPAARAR